MPLESLRARTKDVNGLQRLQEDLWTASGKMGVPTTSA